jgi:hypothetical protein
MAEDDWAIRAHAATQREEIELLRGAVAALRAARASGAVRSRVDDGDAAAARSRRVSLVIAVAFSVGVVLTLTAMALYRVALCP